MNFLLWGCFWSLFYHLFGIFLPDNKINMLIQDAFLKIIETVNNKTRIFEGFVLQIFTILSILNIFEIVRFFDIFDVFSSRNAYTAKNTVIWPNFLVWKFYGKAQFPRIARNYAETVPFYKISTPGN